MTCRSTPPRWSSPSTSSGAAEVSRAPDAAGSTEAAPTIAARGPGDTWTFGAFEVHLRGEIRRLKCRRCDAVVVEAVPFADYGSSFTRDFEDVCAAVAKEQNRTATARLLRVSWRTVGNVITRAVERRRIPLSERRLVRIGIDEISYRKHHKYLSLVADHDSEQIVWGGEGKSAATLDGFFDRLGPEGCASIQLVSIDMSGAFIEAVRRRLPHAAIVFDPFHVIKLANTATDEVRRSLVRSLRGTSGARPLKKSRWVLLKDEANLSDAERVRLAGIARLNVPLYRAYLLKEALRAVYRAAPRRAPALLDDWLAWASRSRLEPFVKLARTVRLHRAGILAAIEHGLSNARLEGINNRVRLLSHRAFGFHSANALLALVYLCCGGVHVPLPHERLRKAHPH